MKVKVELNFADLVELFDGYETEWFNVDYDNDNAKLLSKEFRFNSEKLADILVNGGAVIVTDKVRFMESDNENEYHASISLKDINRAINRLAKVEPKQFKYFMSDDEYGYGKTAVIEMAAFKEVRY